jgi:hypothetical protein
MVFRKRPHPQRPIRFDPMTVSVELAWVERVEEGFPRRAEGLAPAATGHEVAEAGEHAVVPCRVEERLPDVRAVLVLQEPEVLDRVSLDQAREHLAGQLFSAMRPARGQRAVVHCASLLRGAHDGALADAYGADLVLALGHDLLHAAFYLDVLRRSRATVWNGSARRSARAAEVRAGVLISRLAAVLTDPFHQRLDLTDPGVRAVLAVDSE